MRKLSLILFLSLFGFQLYGQVVNLGDAELATKIKKSTKPYKVVYILCDYCEPSLVFYPQIYKLLSGRKDVDFYPICAQSSAEVEAYMENHKVGGPIYVVNQNRKRKWYAIIDFYNPISAASDYLTKFLGIDADKMGASSFVVLNEKNKVIAQTTYETEDNSCLNILKKAIR